MVPRTLMVAGLLAAACSCSSTVTQPPDSTADAGADAEAPADAGGDSAASCSAANCTGCCLNGACQAGTTSAGCGKNGAACVVCSSPQVCGADQTCGIDPASTWTIQPVSASISTTNQGADWDLGGGAPDPYVSLWCPPSASTPVSTPAVQDSFSPTWSTGGCSMKAKDLLSVGFALAVFDQDVSFDDTIASKGTIVPKEQELIQGSKNLTNNVTLLSLKVTFTMQ